MKRYHAGTTGGRWNCPHPPAIEELISGSTKRIKNSGGVQEPTTDAGDPWINRKIGILGIYEIQEIPDH